MYIGDDASPDNPESTILKYKKALAITYKKFKSNIGQTCLVSHWERCVNLIRNEKDMSK